MQQGFPQGPRKEGEGNVVHVLWLSPLLTPLCFSILNLRAALGKNWLVLKRTISSMVSWNSRTLEQGDCDQ